MEAAFIRANYCFSIALRITYLHFVIVFTLLLIEWNVIEKNRRKEITHSTQYFVCVRVWIRHMSYAFFKMKFHLLAKCFDFSYIQKQSGFEIFQLEWYGAITNSDFLCFLIISFYVELAFGSLELMLNRDSTN